MKTQNVYHPYLIISILGLLLVAPADLQVWGWREGRFYRHVSFQSTYRKVIQGDLNDDGVPEHIQWDEKHSQLRIISSELTSSDGELVDWQSPDTWEVKQAAFTDLNRDGKPEVTLLVWRDFAPWFIDRYIPSGGRINGFHNAQGKSCHIILIGWENGRIREVWAGSAMVDPVLSFIPADIDADGFQELITLEGRYAYANNGWALSAWKWEGFGFIIINRLAAPFQYLELIEDKEGTAFLLAQK